MTQLVVSDAARELIKERGGRLYVRMKKARCCGAVTTLVSSTEPPAGVEFCRIQGDSNFEVFLPAHLGRLPDELHVEARRFPRRIEAYWNGCAWVV